LTCNRASQRWGEAGRSGGTPPVQSRASKRIRFPSSFSRSSLATRCFLRTVRPPTLSPRMSASPADPYADVLLLGAPQELATKMIGCVFLLLYLSCRRHELTSRSLRHPDVLLPPCPPTHPLHPPADFLISSSNLPFSSLSDASPSSASTFSPYIGAYLIELPLAILFLYQFSLYWRAGDFSTLPRRRASKHVLVALVVLVGVYSCLVWSEAFQLASACSFSFDSEGGKDETDEKTTRTVRQDRTVARIIEVSYQWNLLPLIAAWVTGLVEASLTLRAGNVRSYFPFYRRNDRLTPPLLAVHHQPDRQISLLRLAVPPYPHRPLLRHSHLRSRHSRPFSSLFPFPPIDLHLPSRSSTSSAVKPSSSSTGTAPLRSGWQQRRQRTFPSPSLSVSPSDNASPGSRRRPTTCSRRSSWLLSRQRFTRLSFP
jgi:hypothetical protein